MSEFRGVDFFDIDELLSDEERAVRDTVREFVDRELLDNLLIEKHNRAGTFPEEIVPKLAELGWTPRDSDGHLTRKLRGELICVLPNFCATDAAVVGEARRAGGELQRVEGGGAEPEGAE